MGDKKSISLRALTDTLFDRTAGKKSSFFAPVFPKKIGKYSFVEEVGLKKEKNAYRYGIYQNKSGKKAIAKQWSGRQSSLSAFWMSNEITVYKILHAVMAKHSEKLKEFQQIRIPNFISAIDQKNEKILLIEYVEGKSLEEFSEEKKLRVYAKTLRYLSYIDDLAHDDMRASLLRRSVFFSLLMLPVITLRAILRYPGYFLIILRAVFSCVIRIPLLMKDGLAFSHRDLSDWNILVCENAVYIIDFQLSALAHPLFDAVSLSLKTWDDPKFGKKFLGSDYMKDVLFDKRRKESFLALSAYLMIYNLSLQSGRSDTAVTQFFLYQLREKRRFSLRAYFRDVLKKIKQEAYIYMYSSSKKVKIEPFDPNGIKIAKSIIQTLRGIVPENFPIHLMGSLSMGIAGQRDIDIFIECPTRDFSVYSEKINAVFGRLVRKKREYVEWTYFHNNWEVDILLIDPETEKFKSQSSVVWTVQKDKSLCKAYEKLKWKYNGKSLREYERAKNIFFRNLV